MYIDKFKKIVIKIGSSILIDEKGKPKKKWLQQFAKDIKTLLDDYSVAIIPVSMDKVIGNMFGNTMNLDYYIGQHPSRRYYNIFTRGEVQFAIRDLKNPDKIYGEKYANEYPALQKLKKDKTSKILQFSNKL